jgi:hypothetical protein
MLFRHAYFVTLDISETFKYPQVKLSIPVENLLKERNGYT